MSIDDFFDKFLRATQWLWLPFYGLYRTINDIADVIEEAHAKAARRRTPKP